MSSQCATRMCVECVADSEEVFPPCEQMAFERSFLTCLFAEKEGTFSETVFLSVFDRTRTPTWSELNWGFLLHWLQIGYQYQQVSKSLLVPEYK